MNSKPRIIKDYTKLDDFLLQLIGLKYPHGFSKHLIHITDRDNRSISALPFETEDKYYLIRMTKDQAVQIQIALQDEEEEDSEEFVNEEIIEEYNGSLEDKEVFED